MRPEVLVSVIIPTYNRGFCILEAVESVFRQTHASLECIVIDDGSSDRTAELLAEAARREPRLRFLPRDHRGVSAARNHGLRHAAGAFVTFLDSDDLMAPRRLEIQLERLAKGDAEAVLGRQEQVLVGVTSRPAWLERRPDWWNGHYYMSVLVDTERARAVGGFDETMEVGEDVDFVVRLRGSGARVAVIDDVIVARRYFGDNVTYSLGEHAPTWLSIVRGHLARRRAVRPA